MQNDNVTNKTISKTTSLSFPGLTGESRKTLDARLRTSGMTYKDVICNVTNDRISKFKNLGSQSRLVEINFEFYSVIFIFAL